MNRWQYRRACRAMARLASEAYLSRFHPPKHFQCRCIVLEDKDLYPALFSATRAGAMQRLAYNAWLMQSIKARVYAVLRQAFPPTDMKATANVDGSIDVTWTEKSHVEGYSISGTVSV